MYRLRQYQGRFRAPSMRLVGRHPADRKKMAAVTEKNSRSADALARVERFSPAIRLSSVAETAGRTRSESIWPPRPPDLRRYGLRPQKPELGQDSQCLHAKELRFVHPRTGKPVTVPVNCRTILPRFGKTAQRLQKGLTFLASVCYHDAIFNMRFLRCTFPFCSRFSLPLLAYSKGNL